MELEFDKEIDALLRKAVNGGRPMGETLSVHLDADELSAFAENVLPAKTRALHMAHIADCDRCRRILSNLVMLNSEAEVQPIEAAAVVPSIAPAAIEPWYRKLMLFPNLAYVMGGLVLVFGGLITFSVLQTASNDQGAAISQVSDQAPAARGPMAPSEPDYGSAAANTSANAANMVANSNAISMSESSNKMAASASNNMNAATSAPMDQPKGEAVANAAPAPLSIDGLSAAQPAPPPPAITKPAAPSKEDSVADKDLARTENESEERKRSAADLKLKQSPRRDSGGTTKAAPGPEMGRQVYPNQSSNTFELPTRRVGGKDFSRRNNVWYDEAYNGQATTNVRRNTDDYRKLDRGLRTIAESLEGVVVVVWTGKAYRIQ